MHIVNAPFLFYGLWALVKGWLDEKTVKKIFVHGSSYKSSLLEHVDEENLIDFLGGKCHADLSENVGPWNEFDVVDGSKKGQHVGIRRKGQLGGPIFTPQDLERLPNSKLSKVM